MNNTIAQNSGLFIALFTILIFALSTSEAFGQVQCSDSDGTQDVCVIGELGSADGQFRDPWGITVNSTHLFVGEFGNARIQIFDRDGTFVNSFGGIIDGSRFFPNDISSSPTRIFIADPSNHRILIFDHDGNHVKSFGGEGNGTGQFDSQRGIHANADRLFVGDTENHRIQIFDHDGNHVNSFGSKGSGDGQFNRPHYITSTSTNIFVVDHRNYRVQIFDHNGTFVKSFGSEGIDDGQFGGANDITSNADHLFVVDTGNNRIQIFDHDGNHVNSFGSKGSGEGQFDSPLSVSVNSTHLFVAESGNDRVQVFNLNVITTAIHSINDVQLGISTTRSINVELSGFDDTTNDGIFDDTDGIVYTISSSPTDIVEISSTGVITITIPDTYVGDDTITVNVTATQGAITVHETFLVSVFSFFGTGQLSNPFSITTSPAHVFVLDTYNHRILIFDHDGVIVKSFGRGFNFPYGSVSEFYYPIGISSSPTRIFITDTFINRIQIWDHDGNHVKTFGGHGSDDGEFITPYGIHANADHLFVVDTGNNRTQIFDHDGNHVKSFGSEGSAEGQFNDPWGITTTSTHLFVVDRNNHRIQIFDHDGNHVNSFGSKGSGDGQFGGPTDIASNADHLFVVDRNNHRIQIFDHDGNHVNSFGSEGSAEGQFDSPVGVSVNSTHLFVVEVGNDRVQVLNLSFVLPPVITLPEIDISYPEQEQITLDFDTNDTSARFSIDSSFIDNPPIIDEITGVLTWTPSEVQDSVHDITIQLERNGLVSEETISLNITEIKTKPVLTMSLNAFEIKDTGIVRFGKNTVTVFDPDVVNGRPQNGTSLVGGISQPSAGLRVGNNAILVNGILQDRDGTPIYYRAADILNDIPDVYAVTLSRAPNGLTFSAITNEFKWRGSVGDPGEYDFEISARNTRIGSVTESVNVTVNVLPSIITGSAPSIRISQENLNTIVREPLAFDITKIDSDSHHNLLRYSVELEGSLANATAAGLEIDDNLGASTSTLKWTPNATHVGVHQVTLIVTDNTRLTGRDTLTITVVANENPSVNLLNVQDRYTAGEPIHIEIDADDDVDTPTLSISSTTTGSNQPIINSSTPEVSWTPTIAQIGDHTITVTATDTADNTGSQAITITVFAANVPPTITSPTIATSYPSGNAISLNFDATDERNSPITFSLETDVKVSINPLGFKPTLHPTTGVIHWTPTIKQVGVYTFTITADDGDGGDSSARETFTINVTDNSVPQIIPLYDEPIVFATVRSFTTIQREVDSEFETTSAQFTSIDPQFRNFGVTSTFTNSNATLRVTPGAGHVGSYPVSLTLGYNNDPTKTTRYIFTLYVVDVPDGAMGSSMATHLVPDFTVRASDDDIGQTINQQSFVIDTFDNTGKSKSSSDSSEWKKSPTFGKSADGTQLVKEGFIFNGHKLTITDNWHTEFPKTDSIIGDTNIVSLKVHSVSPLYQISLALGVSEIGNTHDAETEILLTLEENYGIPSLYDVLDINHIQTESLIDPSKTDIEITQVPCGVTDDTCTGIDIKFAINAPLVSNVLSITAIDDKSRSTTTYINDGVEFTGESLLLAKQHTIHSKVSNQDALEIIVLTQDDRRFPVYTDQYGNQWTHNEYDTWSKITQDDTTAPQDDTWTVMNRMHSGFDSYIIQEQDKARAIFDSNDIQNDIKDSFAFDIPEITDRLSDQKLLERLDVETRRALASMQ